MPRENTQEIEDWFRNAVAESRTYKSSEMEKKRAGDLAQVDLSNEGAYKRQGLANEGQMNVQGLQGRQQSALETLKGDIAKPLQTAQASYYNEVAGEEKAKSTQQGLFNTFFGKDGNLEKMLSGKYGAPTAPSVESETAPVAATALQPVENLAEPSKPWSDFGFGNPLTLERLSSLANYISGDGGLKKRKPTNPFATP